MWNGKTKLPHLGVVTMVVLTQNCHSYGSKIRHFLMISVALFDKNYRGSQKTDRSISENRSIAHKRTDRSILKKRSIIFGKTIDRFFRRNMDNMSILP